MQQFRDGERISIPFVAKVRGENVELVPEGISSGLHWTLAQNEAQQLKGITQGMQGGRGGTGERGERL